MVKACPVCGSHDTVLYATAKDHEYDSVPGTFTYLQCKTCISIFIHPVPADLLHRIYPPNYYSFQPGQKNLVHRLKEWLDKRFFKKLMSTLPGDQLSVLDVGGGTGWLSTLLRHCDARVQHTQIVDIDAGAATLARAAGHNYFEGKLEDFTTDQRYDLVMMLNLVEHVSDPAAVLKKAALLLKDNGVIVIKTPNADSWQARIFQKTYWGGLHSPRHWVIFSGRSFLKVIPKGMVVARMSYTQGAPFWAFSIIAALHKKGMVHVSRDRPIVYHPLYPVLAGLFAAVDFVCCHFSKTAQMFIVLKKEEPQVN